MNNSVSVSAPASVLSPRAILAVLSDLRIVAVSINPIGGNVGLEKVVPINTGSVAADLADRTLEDRNGKREPLNGETLAAADAHRVRPTGDDTRFSDKARRLASIPPGGKVANVAHAVTYSKGRAAEPNNRV